MHMVGEQCYDIPGSVLGTKYNVETTGFYLKSYLLSFMVRIYGNLNVQVKICYKAWNIISGNGYIDGFTVNDIHTLIERIATS